MTRLVRWLGLGALVGALVGTLAGCAGLNTVTSDVATFGDWPAGRSPSTYAFDRLPSQQASPELARATAALEAAAAGGLAKAGFRPAAAGETPDVLVQLGERHYRTAQDPIWVDPLWYRGAYGPWRANPWVGPGWWVRSPSLTWDRVRYEREAALLIRDRATGKPLYEARASHDGATRGDDRLVAAMFEAMLVDFPKTGVNPRRVTVTLPAP